MTNQQQNWWQLSSIQIGGVICLPVIMIGHTLSQMYGFASAVISILLGNAALLFLGFISGKMAFEKRKPTIENALEYFGEKGIAFFALAMTFSVIGWFGIQLNMMSISILDLLSIEAMGSSWLLAFNVFFGVLITFVALFGIKGMNILSDLSLPLLIATLCYACFTIEEKVEISEPTLSLGGISLVIAMAIVLVIDLPTYYRHARGYKDVWVSIFIIFALALPLLEILGVYLASGSSQGTILEILKRQNGPIWNIWVASFLILAGWTTNNLNLYTGAVALGSVFRNCSEKSRTLWVGGFGTLLSCFDLLNNLEVILGIMGILISSMGAVVITRYLLVQYKGFALRIEHQSWHLAAWTCGIIVGFLGMAGFSLTSISVLDATIAASFGTLLTLTRQKRYEETYT